MNGFWKEHQKYVRAFVKCFSGGIQGSKEYLIFDNIDRVTKRSRLIVFLIDGDLQADMPVFVMADCKLFTYDTMLQFFFKSFSIRNNVIECTDDWIKSIFRFCFG